MLITAGAQAAAATHGLTATETSLLVAGIGLVGVITTAVLGAALGRWAEATNRRRAQYADAIATLVAWAEYPYRIRRRTADTPEELARLAALGHDLHERLRSHQTWITTDSASTARAYQRVYRAISSRTGPASKEAWDTPPVTDARGMNLNGWGPGDSTEIIDSLQIVIVTRFGWRRLLLGLTPLRARRVLSEGD